jgi:xanthine dehydrogenase small subunit
MTSLRFNLNGSWVEETAVPATTTLLRYLRDSKRLMGTKEGCAEGDCGACTVAVVENGRDGQPVYRAVNACLLLLPMVQGKHVVTVEALQTQQLHPAQEAMSKALGSQCGYCTPGIVMTMFEATYRTDLEAAWQLDDQLCGNLCRCTGYRPIRQAAQQVAGTCPVDAFSKALPSSAPTSMELSYRTDRQQYFTPIRFEALWELLEQHADARFVVGGSDLSLEITKRFQVPPTLVSLEALPALQGLEAEPGGFRIGSGVTIAQLEAFTVTRLPSLHRMVRYFGARQIKHRATVGGNLCTASPIGDLAPVLLSLGATAVLQSRAGERRVPLEAFFVGYRKTALRPQEILAAIEVPTPNASARAVAYKVSKRRELDISTVSAGLYVETDSANVVTVARLAFGGMAATVKRAAQAEAALVGQVWSAKSADSAARALKDDFTPLADHRGSSAYRALVAANLVRGFFEETWLVRQPALVPGHTATVQTADEVARAR